jgi:anti-anti-sigma factor
MLEASVTAGRSGLVITLSGEADVTNVTQLTRMISAQLSDGSNELTLDISGLRFIDAAAIRPLLTAAMTMNERGGTVILLRPQRPVARILALLGADHIFTIRGTAGCPAHSDGRAT